MIGSFVQIAADLVMIIFGSIIFFQNHQYWRKYGGNASVYWFMAGASIVFLGCWVILTRFLLPELFTLDSHVVDLLALSRRILFAVIGLYFLGVGFWEYVLNK